MNSKIKKIFVIIILILSVTTSSYAADSDRKKETKTFAGALGSLFRQVWISFATFFENSIMGEDNETVFYDLTEEDTEDTSDSGIILRSNTDSLTLYCKINSNKEIAKQNG